MIQAIFVYFLLGEISITSLRTEVNFVIKYRLMFRFYAKIEFFNKTN